MAPPRFGASKYRNSLTQIGPREEFYRGHLPPFSIAQNASSSSLLTTFSSEIKSNREWLVTVTPHGDLSYRGYRIDSKAGIERVGQGGGVGDWDLSRLEDNTLIIGNLDGSISVYSLPESPTTSSSLTLRQTIPPASSSPITHVLLHPTTPNIVLVSSISHPLSIYDISPSIDSASITLNIKEPKGIWSFGWSNDGRKIGVVGKSGNLSIYEPRKSKDPITTKNLTFSNVQPLKPCKLVWLGNNQIFLTSFSKSRNRQFSLYQISNTSSNTTIETIFNENLDTSQGILIPLIDNERKLIYLIGKGDMTLRQLEISPGTSLGYQETIHQLPYPLSTSSITLKHQTKSDVMKAEIAQILIPIIDKDGDALIPLSIKIPRRQLIDYHDDLYPDIIGTVPEQTAEEWLKGENKAPQLITLDPARRHVWEGKVEEYQRNSSRTSSKHSDTIPEISSSPNPPTSTIQANIPQDTPEIDGKYELGHQSPAHDTPSPSTQSSAADSQGNTSIPIQTSNVPKLDNEETYSSTSYKSRIVADYLAIEFARHRSGGGTEPLMVGLQGPQGCGKTTLCSGFVRYLKEKKELTAAVLSLDDLYKTHEGLKAIAAQHPDNALLSGRGPPGTHDTELAVSVLEQVKRINDSPDNFANLPIFDKSLCGGEGDRSSETVKIAGPIDVFILEGWSMGFLPLGEKQLEESYSKPKAASLKTSDIFYVKHPLQSLKSLNEYLSEFSSSIYSNFKGFIQIEPLSYDYVFRWRLQQEHNMKEKNGGKGMTDEQVKKFVERYMPGYELWKEGIWNKGTTWEGRGLKLVFGPEREVLDVIQPQSTAQLDSNENSAPVEAKEKFNEDTKGDIQLKQVEQLAAEKDIKLIEKDLAAMKVEKQKEVEVTPFPPAPAPASSTPISAPAPAPVANIVSTDASPSSNTNLSQASKLLTAITPSESTEPSTQRSTTQAPTQERYNPNWSRKFLAGKSPLIPSYDSLPALSSLHQDSKILKANANLAFFPIQGTGGRLNVHPLSKKGRLSIGGEGYLSAGVEIVDFDVELAGDRVAVAGEDGIIRIWSVPKDGMTGVGPEPNQVLKGKGIDKITQIAFHPTAKDLLVGLTNDHGSSNIRFWDLSAGEETKVEQVSDKGVFNFSFSPQGDRVAIAAKDNQILVLDPRKPSDQITGKAHDSPRSFQIVWIDETHLASVGFSRGSQRKINSYEISSGTIETISSITIDVSPSVLFPVYDPDTSILYIWGKGERVIQSFEVQLNSRSTEKIVKLPSYTAGQPQVGLVFLPKRLIDVRKVEIAKCLRLTAKTMEEVTFTIPRNKPEFFQDDIYVPTIDVEKYVTTAPEWLQGENTLPSKIDLRPEGMISLSQAPKNDSAATKKFVPAANVMSEEEKKRKEMDDLFKKAKMDESSDEEDVPIKGLAPPDDDW
ncbi:uncharacterized protein L201_000187 [Kwoniella dendrophila CBS 6074]|uniref:Actin cross-linking n=1 Tax=Kwoniella dendrophila CBS 6074 TaxID=1295534 RepID=A0AAX4JLC0_9TREE